MKVLHSRTTQCSCLLSRKVGNKVIELFPWDEFKDIQLLGRGGYADIYKATFTGEVVLEKHEELVKKSCLKDSKKEEWSGS